MKVVIDMDNCVTYSSFNRSYTDRKLQNKCDISYAVFYTNVLMAGILKELLAREILLNENISFFIPEFAINEIEKYKNELMPKAGYTLDDFDFLMEYLSENIEIVPKEEIQPFMKNAEEIMKNIDVKDSSFIALCLSLKADGIFSFDKHFLQQKAVKVFLPEELIEYF